MLSPRYLSELTERVKGQLRFELWHGVERLLEHVEPVDLLARDEWGGLASLPEVLAAFVMPNHPAVEPILRGAADILRAWTGDPSLSGYQSKDPALAYTMAGAIYTALQQLDITYINPPVSFETEGQRVRFPDHIVESRMGTCLDLAVLAAGTLEQAGLHPLVVLVQGHAFVGVWLREECFGEPAIDEPLHFRKRVDLDEIAVFDPTASPTVRFSASMLRSERPSGAWRSARVLMCHRRAPGAERPDQTPAGTSGTTGPVRRWRDARGTSATATSAPDISALHTPLEPLSTAAGKVAETPATRLDRWRRRLLDLSLRNRLLNFRDTNKTIPLLCPDLPALENALADGVTFHILPRPRDLAEGDPRDPEAYRRRTGEEAIAALLREQLRAKRLHADLGGRSRPPTPRSLSCRSPRDRRGRRQRTLPRHRLSGLV